LSAGSSWRFATNQKCPGDWTFLIYILQMSF
jgi:hypothetical protein